MKHDRYFGNGELETFEALSLLGLTMNLYNMDMNEQQLINDKKEAQLDRERNCRIESKLDYIISKLDGKI